MANVQTIDGCSPAARYAAYAAYAVAAPIVGLVRLVVAVAARIWDGIESFRLQESQRGAQSGGLIKRLGHKIDNFLDDNPLGQSKKRIARDNQQIVRALSELVYLGAWYYTYQEATNYVVGRGVHIIESDKIQDMCEEPNLVT